MSTLVHNEKLRNVVDWSDRLANPEIKNSPRRNHIQSILTSGISQQQLQVVLKNTQQALRGNGATTNIDSQNMPQLRVPATTNAMTGHAEMIALLGKVGKLISDNSLQKLLSQCDVYNKLTKANIATYSELAKDLESKGIEYTNATDQLNDANKQEQKLAQDIKRDETTLTNAEDKLKDLQQQADKQDPVKAELQQQIDAAQAAVNTAQQRVNTATEQHAFFVNNTLTTAINNEKNAKNALENSQRQVETFVASLSDPELAVTEANAKAQDADTKSLTFLMALMSQIINKNANEELSNTAELKQKLAQEATKEAEKKAREYDEQMRKAEESQKTMGCIGKALGWVVTAVGFAAAAFTGGASLAVAAVGLAIMAGNEISIAATGNDFLADAMQPLMENVIKPMMDFFGDMFTDVLTSLGVDAETAKTVGKVMGAVLTAVMLIAAMMVAASAVGSVAGSVMSKFSTSVAEDVAVDVAEETVKSVVKDSAEEVAADVAKSASTQAAKEAAKDSAENLVSQSAESVSKSSAEEVAQLQSRATIRRLMDSAFMQTLKRANQGIGRLLGMDELQAAQMANRAQRAYTAVSLGNTGIVATGNAITADMFLDAAKTRKQLVTVNAEQELINKLMEMAIDSFTSKIQAVNQILKNMVTAADNKTQTAKFITRQIGMAG
ncbi:type III secretion system translocon subunit SctE [Pantoea agglomerans]|uniref:type III secretion system translocon subunit SctE n=1 Tax=Enterobacter agglomerans TaxID=549 RepID=UPI0013B75AAE|nr:type III secretion system translocon subunit SctE [Pantoea agglomerans]NEG59848.1 YopB/SseC family type III secretion system translocon subunit [Pantoea agglomerans]NEG98817.1 YopB/SseC family type III secretion system translocon subunit [Pantoea agglomerans]NEH05199.1 YopB/SseC family type III secretion system translocon subunit [Pantoea agglomerans]NEH16188.1 YopB/SseC family type III secretion system translocon subunit [Pantoea agglomerans]